MIAIFIADGSHKMIFDQQYLQLCSEKTLQSNKDGFFLQFAEAVAENVGEQWVKKFGKLKTDKERIRRIYEDDTVSLSALPRRLKKKSSD